MGRRMDDAGAITALSTVGHIRHRQRATSRSFKCALVFAMALRAMAGRERRVI
jgi:hypothetical protein